MKNRIFFRSTLSPLSSIQNENFFEPNFIKSIYLSSPNLYSEMLKMKVLPDKRKNGIKKTLLKYWNRYCSRCTPFGTFAGCSLLNFEQTLESLIVLAEKDKHIEQSRLDTNYLYLLVQWLLKKENIRNKVSFYSNNTLYEVGEEYRYVGYQTINNDRKYFLNSVDKTFPIYASIEKAKIGITFPNLISYITDLMGVSTDEARSFVEELYESQILISELSPPITGYDQLDTLIERLEKISVNDNNLISDLKEVNNLLKKTKKEISEFQSIERKLKRVFCPTTDNINFFHVDTYLSVTQPKIDRNIINKIIDQSKELMVLARPYNINNELSDFISKFKLKYGDEEIGLNVVLDVESGIGYAGINENEIGEGKIISDLYIEQNSPVTTIYKDHIREFVLMKYEEFLKNKTECIEIEEKELNKFHQIFEKAKFSRVVPIFGTLIKDNKHEFVFEAKKFGGASSANLLGRFSFSNQEIKDYISEILSEEEKQNQGCIYAEIVHLHNTRVGNISLRPFLSEYEITYFGQSGLPRRNQITVDDLMVSIQGEEIILRSKTHNKRVIPRLTNAHNFKYQTLPVYNFLCDLQFQSFWIPGIWDWGDLEGFKYLPRVVFKNIIIEKAKWKINSIEFKNDIYKPETINEFCLKNHIPSKVIYSEGDNDLLIDFEFETGREIFKDIITKHDEITVKECLYTNENCFVTDKYGNSYTNEVLIPFINDKAISNADKLVLQSSKKNIKAKFLPNSEWCYFKIYCGYKAAEKILRTNFFQFIEDGLKKKSFEKFFFIRFKDDSPHIRVRFFNQNISTQLKLCKDFLKMLKPFVENKIIDKIVIDTYEREMSRYGKQYIESAESLFFSDSLAVLKVLSTLKDVENSSKYRLLFGIRGIDILLNDFGYNISEKKFFSRFVSKSYLFEFGDSELLFKQLNTKYREYQNDIFSHLNSDFDIRNNIKEVIDIFMERSAFNKDIIFMMQQKKDFTVNRNRYVQSYLHMFLNRLFISNQRKYELIIYFFLDRYYTSQIAIINKKV